MSRKCVICGNYFKSKSTNVIVCDTCRSIEFKKALIRIKTLSKYGGVHGKSFEHK